jgi:copper chaperone CopZ
VANSRASFTVRGVESSADADEIEADLRDREGVQLVDIDPETGETEVRHGEELISGAEIRGAVADLGYEVDSPAEREENDRS